jgi:hypothetical protein
LRRRGVDERFLGQQNRAGLVADLRREVIELLEKLRANAGPSERCGDQSFLAAPGKKNENGSA